MEEFKDIELDTLIDYELNIYDILESSFTEVSNIKPSSWAENFRIMPSNNSMPGKFGWRNAPYAREILDCGSASHPAKRIAIMKGVQIGMALDEETKIPTPGGWSKMKELVVGDKVFDEHGNPCSVIKTTESIIGHKCYNVHFSDGSIIKADADHLWTVWDEKKYETRKLVTINTEEIKRTYKFRNGKCNRYAVDVAKPLNTALVELPIHPYLLGVWLGDGESKGNRITSELNDSKELIKHLDVIGVNTVTRPYRNSCNVVSVAIIKPLNECSRGHKYLSKNINGANICLKCKNDRYNNRVKPLKYPKFGKLIRDLGVYGNKHIPNIYLRASIEQRLELLQGLMDTDGSVNSNGHCEFTQVNKRLAYDVYELICSLGLKPVIKLRTSNGSLTNFKNASKKYKISDHYRISFKAFSEMPVFKFKRKAERLKSILDVRVSEIARRRIVNVVECESVPVRCITVDTPTHLYLAGESMIPTHNSTSMIQNLIGYMISENPNNIMLLVGHEDLIKDSTERIDNVIDSCGLRDRLRSAALKSRRVKSGDTDKKKEFEGGYLMIGSTNHKTLRQVSIQTMIVDDFDAMKGASKDAGSTTKMIEARTTAFNKKKKIYYISTPELKETSNIEPVYEMGDQRRYHIPCPCCDELIILEWEIPSELVPNKNAGMTWELTPEGKLIPESVGYTCQKCDGFFDDSDKGNWLLEEGFGGRSKWVPTAIPSDPEYYSYQISALYAPIYMDGWIKYVRDFLEANPPNQPRNEEKHQTFVNLCLGLTYEISGESISATILQENIRDYEIGTIPEKISIEDGNGKIVLVTCASDLNGKEDDARLDYEIVAHSESGATYSISHGSIGTFIPKDNNPLEREHFTYRFNEPLSVWPEFEELLGKKLINDARGIEMPIFITGLDVGHMANYAYMFIDSTSHNVVGLKGDGIVKSGAEEIIMARDSKLGADKKIYRASTERRKLYMVETNKTKDNLNMYMQLNWTEGVSSRQPYGYMNFPTPSNGLYLFNNYFKHFEAERKVIDKKGNYRWMKKSNYQNHLYDCRLYNLVVKAILIDMVFSELKIKNGVWADYVAVVNRNSN